MWEILLRLLEVAVVLGGSIGSLYAGRLYLQAQKHQAISEAKDELVKVTMNDREAWKSRYDAKELEYINYREQQHDHNNEANATVVRLTAQNAELKSRTDLSPILQFNKEQSQINTKIVQSLDAILSHLVPKPPRKLRHAPRL